MKDKITDLIKIYPNALPQNMCDTFITYFKQHHALQNINGKQKYSHLINSRWTEINMIKHMPKSTLQNLSEIMLHYKAEYESDCQMVALPPPGAFADLRLKKYDNNNEDCFETHIDSYGPASNRYLVFLFTLNDVEVGGNTRFVDFDISLKPEAGRLVIFPPFWMYRHIAEMPISAPKYIINTFCVW